MARQWYGTQKLHEMSIETVYRMVQQLNTACPGNLSEDTYWECEAKSRLRSISSSLSASVARLFNNAEASSAPPGENKITPQWSFGLLPKKAGKMLSFKQNLYIRTEFVHTTWYSSTVSYWDTFADANAWLGVRNFTKVFLGQEVMYQRHMEKLDITWQSFQSASKFKTKGSSAWG